MKRDSSADDLELLRGLIGRPRSDVLKTVKRSEKHVDDGYDYQSLENLAIVRPKKLSGARLYFDEDELVMISVAEPDVSVEWLQDLMGESERLRSRQGKRARLQVDAAAGIAFSVDDDDIGWVELFPPMDFEEYRDRIWWEPPAFKR